MYLWTRDIPEEQKEFLRKKFDELLESDCRLRITNDIDEYNDVAIQIDFRYFLPRGPKGGFK